VEGLQAASERVKRKSKKAKKREIGSRLIAPMGLSAAVIEVTCI